MALFAAGLRVFVEEELVFGEAAAADAAAAGAFARLVLALVDRVLVDRVLAELVAAFDGALVVDFFAAGAAGFAAGGAAPLGWAAAVLGFAAAVLGFAAAVLGERRVVARFLFAGVADAVVSLGIALSFMLPLQPLEAGAVPKRRGFSDPVKPLGIPAVRREAPFATTSVFRE